MYTKHFKKSNAGWAYDSVGQCLQNMSRSQDEPQQRTKKSNVLVSTGYSQNHLGKGIHIKHTGKYDWQRNIFINTTVLCIFETNIL